jgi:hypothetical protein
MNSRPLLVFAGLLFAVACDDGSSEAPVVARFTCTRPDEAPLPDGVGGHRCVRVGAREGLRADLWPVTDGLPGPLVFVRPDAPAGGDGTRDRPFNDLGVALDRGAASVALSSGAHQLAAVRRVTAALTLVGADASTTRVVFSTGGAFSAESALTLRSLTLQGMGATADSGAAVRANAGASLVLDDVVIEGGARGVVADGASLVARHLTVRRTLALGVELIGRTRAVMSSVLVRDGARSGISLDRSRIHLREALIASNARYGLALLGDVEAGGGFGDCRAADPGASAGDRDCLAEVACLDDHVAAVQITGRRAVEARLLFLAGTTPGDATTAADGLFAGDGADVTLDPEIAVEAMQGFGSEVVANARFGVLVDGGDRPEARARVSVRGAVVRGNGRGGMMLQHSAEATRVEFSRFESNWGVGLVALPSTTLRSIGCNGFLATRPAALRARAGDGRVVTLNLADGLSVEGAPGLEVLNNRFDGNGRFAAIFSGAVGRLDGNTGSGNRYGLGVYESPTLVVSAGNRVAGREPAPAVNPGIFAPSP